MVNAASSSKSTSSHTQATRTAIKTGPPAKKPAAIVKKPAATSIAKGKKPAAISIAKAKKNKQETIKKYARTGKYSFSWPVARLTSTWTDENRNPYQDHANQSTCSLFIELVYFISLPTDEVFAQYAAKLKKLEGM